MHVVFSDCDAPDFSIEHGVTPPAVCASASGCCHESEQSGRRGRAGAVRHGGANQMIEETCMYSFDLSRGRGQTDTACTTET